MPPALPTETFSLGEFCQTARELLESPNPDDGAAFVRFALTGMYNGHQAVVDPILNRVRSSETLDLQLRRDFDSVLGISKSICVHSSEFTVYPLPKYEDSLSKNVHLEFEFENTNGRHMAPLHQIPNFCIAKWKLHNCIRILFVDLYSRDHKTHHVSVAEQTEFYEKGLYPTVVELLEDRASDWPATYAAERFRARGRGGQFAFGTKVLPDWTAPLFGERLRHHLVSNGVRWGTNLFFLHEIRGVKNSSYHCTESESAEVALEELLDMNFLRLRDLDPNLWYIDVGLEISSTRKRCLAWRTDSHSKIIQELAKIEPHHANRITEFNNKRYYRDPASHLVGVSGFRLTPGVLAQGRYKTQYMNVYLTDKGITYRPDRGHYGKFIEVSDTFSDHAANYLDNLYEHYMAAAKENYSCARMEIRVPLTHATEPMVYINSAVLQQSLISFSREEWWSLRALRAAALKYVAEWQLSGEPAVRTSESALLLTAAIPWLANGLHSTPDTKPASRELMNAILPHIRRRDAVQDQQPYKMSLRGDDNDGDDDDEEDEEDGCGRSVRIRRHRAGNEADGGEGEGEDDTVPHNPFGLIFLRDIRVGSGYPVPRMYNEHFYLSERAFLYLFKADRYSIQTEIIRSRIALPRNPSRIANRTKQKPIAAAPETAGRNPFGLMEQGHSLLPPPHDDGSDMDIDSDDENDEIIEDMDAELFRLWSQFCLDIISVCPNRKGVGQASYCKLGEDERKKANTSTYQDVVLSNNFNDVQWKAVSTAEWRTNFKRLFPDKEKKLAGRVQNYNTVAYYAMWQGLMHRMTDEALLAAHKQLWKIFKSLYWMPAACSDRIWETKPTPSFSKSSEYPKSKAAPKVLLNGVKEKPVWSNEVLEVG